MKPTEKPAQALGHYRRAVASEPENVDALFCKAVVSAQMGELFDALNVSPLEEVVYARLCATKVFTHPIPSP